MRLTQFEALLIGHWFGRAARAVANAGSTPVADAATRAALLNAARRLEAAAGRCDLELAGANIRNPQEAFVRVSDMARQISKKAEVLPPDRSAAEHLAALAESAAAFAEAFLRDDYGSELKALIELAGEPRRGQGTADVIALATAVAPWQPQRALPAARNRTPPRKTPSGGRSGTGGRKASTAGATLAPARKGVRASSPAPGAGRKKAGARHAGPAPRGKPGKKRVRKAGAARKTTSRRKIVKRRKVSVRSVRRKSVKKTMARKKTVKSARRKTTAKRRSGGGKRKR